MAMLLRGSLLLAVLGLAHGGFRLGQGIADITGQAGENTLYGYAKTDQDARGIHTRQYSRAFIFDDQFRRTVLVVAEITMISQALHTEIFERLAERYGDLYTANNVMFSPTHSHSLPGGYHTYFMYNVPQGGLATPTIRAAVDGIVLSIERAHENLQEGRIYRTAGDLTTASVNRSPYSYVANPQEERDRYEYDVDVEMTVLRLTYDDGTPRGMVNLFPVHTTSMKNTNHLISADNKGYSSQMAERALNNDKFPLNSFDDVLAAFALTANGDVSPNINLERCETTDAFCFLNSSTCVEDMSNPALCTGRGPTGAIKANEDDFEDTRIIGQLQFEKAMELFEEEGYELAGIVGSRFTWVNMSQVQVDVDGEQVQLCRASMGYSFGAGASDGPGEPPFVQGMLEEIEELENITDAVFPGAKTQELIDCHAPKPIILPTGTIEGEWKWQPEIVPVQVMRVGSVVFIGIPAEVTTMAGRRLEDVVRQVFADHGGGDVSPVVMSMANCYSSYVVTKEEYQIQRYEAASTIFGPNTLLGYMKIVRELTTAMLLGEDVELGTPPPDLRSLVGEGRGNPTLDSLPEDTDYGDIIIDTEQEYAPGEIVQAVFWAGNPRNKMRTDETFLEVQHLERGDWEVVQTDAHWETKFYWSSNCHDVIIGDGCFFAQTSNATIEWTIPEDQEPGLYRLVHYGAGNVLFVGPVEYVGISSQFAVSHSKKRDPHQALPRPRQAQHAPREEGAFVDMYFNSQKHLIS